MMMKTFLTRIIVMGLIVFVSSCLSLEEKKKKAEEEGNALVAVKSKLLKGVGDALKSDGKEGVQSASEGIGEVIKGVNSGFDKSLNQANIKCDSTFLKTFELGRSEKLYNDTSDLKIVTVYLASLKEYKGKIKLKAYDGDKNEIGRSTLNVSIEEDEAKYFDFKFDKRTPLLQADYFEISK